VPWVEVFAVFLVCHLAGDYLLQTNWQAANKFGGLGPDPTARRALLAHIAAYALGFVPVLVWMGDGLGVSVLWLAAVALPHLVQDDGRLLDLYVRRIKRCEPDNMPAVRAAVDQAFHVLALFALAIVAGV
jgi:type IV secretory pathway TrbD component